MTNEEKELVYKDLCARLFYKVKCEVRYKEKTCVSYYGFTIRTDKINPDTGEVEYKTENKPLDITDLELFSDGDLEIKPYLRPLSSMTDSEYKEYEEANDIDTLDSSETLKENLKAKSRVRISKWYHGVDWLNAHHFDYRNLINKGLALEAPNNMYNINED